jgi:hypothetical protein
LARSAAVVARKSLSPIRSRDSYWRRRCVSAAAGSPASIAIKAAGAVSAAVIVGPRVSMSVFARFSVMYAVSARSCMAYRPAMWRRITAWPLGWFPISLR